MSADPIFVFGLDNWKVVWSKSLVSVDQREAILKSNGYLYLKINPN